MHVESGHAEILKVGYKIANNIIKTHVQIPSQAAADICP